MTRAEAVKRGLPVLGIFRSFAAVGVDPAVMGIGPAVAIPAAVAMAGLSIEDIDLFELNEAFSSQACHRRALGPLYNLLPKLLVHVSFMHWRLPQSETVAWCGRCA